MPAEDVIRRLQARGVKQLVHTNVDRDGMLEGVDLAETERISDIVRGRWIVSGGIGSLDDLRAIAGLRRVNIAGVITGKALYEGRFTVEEGQEVLDGTAAEPDHAGRA
jgi:phosphoribosylformimino-5-aminoimidazole carboxamide ribotide isomerase